MSGIGISLWNIENPVAGPSFAVDFTQGVTPPQMAFVRASAATYFDSNGTRQISPVNVPRYNYDPITKAARGYLNEGTRTNYLTNSLSPANQTTESLAVGVYVLWIEGTGTVTASAGTAVGTFGAATAGSFATISITTAGTVNIAVTGSVSAFQMELGRFPSSLIITAATPATRATDMMSVPLANISYNQAQGTVLVEHEFYGMTTNAPVNGQNLININDGGTSVYIAMYKNTTSNVFRSEIDGSNLSNTVPVTTDVVYKAAMRYLTGDNELAVNGSLVGGAPFQAASITGTRTQINIGNRADGGRPFFGHVRKFTYADAPYINAQLQALTA